MDDLNSFIIITKYLRLTKSVQHWSPCWVVPWWENPFICVLVSLAVVWGW